MSDIVDDAQALEALHRAASLDAALARPPEPGPLYLDGVACCVECQEPIVSARLKAKPGASRCVRCQQALEGGE